MDLITFDALMERVGYEGIFQTRYNIIYNIGLMLVTSIMYNSLIFAFAKPDHWCHVPGREHTNLTRDEWRHLTVPSVLGENGKATYSKCQMFDVDWNKERFINGTEFVLQIIDCRYGWDYDREWYGSTVVTQENWVCEKDIYQTNVFALGRLGEVLGALIFGQLGDRIGRRKLFYISIAVLFTGKIAIILSVSNYALLSVFIVFGTLVANSLSQLPQIVAMEINRPENRASVSLMQNSSWSLAICLMPMIYWAIRDWYIFLWVITAPLVIFVLFPGYMIESPRWLATTGRLAECAKYLTQIGRINRRPTDEITESYLEKMLPKPSHSESQVFGVGVWTFFKGWRIARNTFLLIFSWCLCNLAYFTLLLNMTELPGNPFVNFLIQSIVEFPSYFVGQWLCNNIGRRFTNSLALALSGLMMCGVVGVVKYESLATVTMALVFATKFVTCIAYMSLGLQSLETHPTCLRQTGISLGTFLSNIIGMLGPYIVYMGQTIDAQWPYIILCYIYLVAVVCCVFTVETHLQKLPDSVEEAMHFGENQKFWSFPRAPKEEVSSLT